MACFADRIFRIKNSTPGPGIKGSRIARFESCLVACVYVDPVRRVSGDACNLFSFSPNAAVWLALGVELVGVGRRVIGPEHYHDDYLPQQDRYAVIPGELR